MKQLTGKSHLVAYCGLFCGDCFWHSGRVMNLAAALHKEVTSSGFDRFARDVARRPEGKPYQRFDRTLALLKAMSGFGCRKACRDGGCSPTCELRDCCVQKNLAGCWECSDYETCSKLRLLRPIHQDGYKRNLRALRRKGPEAFVRGRHYWATHARQGPGK